MSFATLRFVDFASLGLGAVSLAVALVAGWIAIRSDRRLKAISDLEFFEKRAAMESYVDVVGTKGDGQETVFRRLANDFAAIAALHRYASEERKRELITAVVPALNRVAGLAGQGQISGESLRLMRNLVAQAQSFGVADSGLDAIAALPLISST